jgi:nucleotide-binding universal stress UspA family protein
MYQQILVALKQHAGDEAIVDQAASLALLTGGRVTVAHVVHSHSRDEAVYLEQKAQTYLAEWVERLQAKGVDAAFQVAQGEPAEALTTLARDLHADLIVMATHGHSEARHVFVGSVTEDVIRGSDAPVLLMQPEAPTTPGWRSAAAS